MSPIRISKRVGLSLFIIFIGGVIGGVIGQAIGMILPEGIVKSFFLNYVSFGFSPFQLDLYFIKFTLGLMFRFNIMSIISVLILGYLLRWLY